MYGYITRLKQEGSESTVPIEIRADFQGGRLKGWRETAEGIHLDVDTLTTPTGPSPWFYFLISGVEGRTVTFHTPGIDLAEAPVALSYDRFHWIPPTEVTPPERFSHHFGENDAIVSLTPPYTPGMLYEFTLWARRSPHVRIEYFDQVYGVTAITISEFEQTEGKPIVWIASGAFPLGAAASWAAEGIVRFLLSSDPTAQRLREDFCFKILVVPDPSGVDSSTDSKVQELISTRVAADQEAGKEIAAFISLQGRTFGDGDTITACAHVEGSGQAPGRALELPTVASHLPWYRVAETLSEESWPTALSLSGGSAQAPYRIQITTGWYYPPHLFAGTPARKSQFDLIQEGELLCRALDAAREEAPAPHEPERLPALVSPSMVPSGEDATVSVWLAETTPRGATECVVCVRGDAFKIPLQATKENSADTQSLPRFTGTVRADQIGGALSVTVERNGIIREMPLAERNGRPSDMSLF